MLLATPPREWRQQINMTRKIQTYNSGPDGDARVRLTTPLFNNSASQDSLDDKAPFKVRLAALLSLVLTVDQHHQRECTSVFEPFCLL